MNKRKKITVVLTAGFIIVFSLLCWFAPKDEYSMSERRYLVKMPELTVKSLFEGSFMSGFENYALDNFPFRDSFRSIKAAVSIYGFGRSDNNGIYVHQGYAAKMEYPLDSDSVIRAAEKFSYIYKRYSGEKGKVYLSVIPDKAYFMAEESGALSFDYGKLVSLLREKMPFAEYIDIFDLLSLEDYYKTDTHWRQEKIIPVARDLTEKMGVEYKGNFEEVTLTDDFKGVYSGQWALPLEKDKLVYLVNDGQENYRVYDWQNSRAISVYDMKKAEENDPYEMFLSGSISLLTIENPTVKSERELVIFRDSFASSLAPLMAESYSKISLVDIRYIRSDFVGSFVDFENADILFLYSTLVLNNSETLK